MTLDELIDFYTPEIANAFRLAIEDITDNIILAEVTRAIEDGDALVAFRALGFSEAAMRPITKKLEDAFEAGGVATGRTFPKRIYTNAGPAVYRFDVRNSRAEKWLRGQAAQVIDTISQSAKENIKTFMFEGVQAGNNPRTTAIEIVGRYDRLAGKRVGGVIGLNEPQAKAHRAMRQDLLNLDNNYFNRELRDKRFDGTVRKMFEAGKVPVEKIDQLQQRYYDRLLKLRGDTIARDAAMEALNRSEYEAMLQASDLGAINKDNTKRAWDSAGDDGRTRDSHLHMDGTEVGLHEPFVFSNGVKVMHPQDRSLPNDQRALMAETINCRCRVRTQIDWLALLD